MDDPGLELLRKNPAWQTTLGAYFDRQQSMPTDSQEAGWIPRLTEIESVPSQQLSSIHGKLIAFGLLKFELPERGAGMMYQLTTEGRRAFLRCLGQPADLTGDSTDFESMTADSQSSESSPEDSRRTARATLPVIPSAESVAQRARSA